VTVTILARVVRGLEWVAADEIATLLPAARPRLAAREVTFETDRWPAPGLLTLRTVDDAFLRVAVRDGVGATRDVPDRVAAWSAGLDWASWRDRLARLRPLPEKPRFDVVASLDGRRSFNRFALENAVGAAIAARLGGMFAARDGAGRTPGETDLTVRLMLRGPQLVVALRLGARPLHRRAYKLATGAGTLHPPLAAAMASLARPAGSLPASPVLADPFCGDGTIAIEAAYAQPAATVLATDLDPARLANARANAGRAGRRIGFGRADAARLPWRPGAVTSVLTNPPWEVAVRAGGALAESLDPFLSALPGVLPGYGRVALVLDAELDGADLLARRGLRVLLGQRIRLAGRISDLLLCAPAGVGGPGAGLADGLADGLAGWRSRALAGGLITEDGF
jgi:23S rRNA G2445 N2-methylase RlmL